MADTRATASRVEELNRPGRNYIVKKNGPLTYHGKSFAPEETPADATHVTVLPDGSYRINAGNDLNPSQQAALRSGTGEANLSAPKSSDAWANLSFDAESQRLAAQSSGLTPAIEIL